MTQLLSIQAEVWNQIPIAVRPAITAIVLGLEARIAQHEARVAELEARLRQELHRVVGRS